MNTNEIFENLIKIEPKVVSIETLFNNEETLRNTKYDPDYQRNYVWDDDKATYFIESILLGTEIPPIIYFRNGDRIEIIDGRQRYQTILRFIKDEFKLKHSGLHKLNKIGIATKNFKDIGGLRDDFWDTKLRIIEFSFHTKSSTMDALEDIVKKEIFKRYNSGITPLKPTEIDKAFYFEDDLNSFIQEKLKADKIIFFELQDLFYFDKSNMQILLKKVRQLLVQHKIPIKYYAIKKDTVISKYYEILSSQIDESNIEEVFSKFLVKINILKRLKSEITTKNFFFNRLVSECVFWALSIVEDNKNSLVDINQNFIKDLAEFINNQKGVFEMDRSSFSKELLSRYTVIGNYFHEKLKVSFNDYLITTTEFKKINKERDDITPQQVETSFDDLRINKPEPSSITIVDICRQMERQRFLLRPPYQRSEVKNRNKSSAIIESILLGIKLPPIFVYKREDGVSEVLDGQQRLLSILGFLKKEYLDENNVKQISNKHGYSLSLKNGILTSLHGKNIDKLDPEQIKKINNFDLWIIEINHRYNKDFEPIDLFLRLNSKPYPIKENTFEMWNSYINKEIIETVKSILKSNQDWFYFRKNNKRMENENLYTALIYLEYFQRKDTNSSNYPLEYYKIGDKINFRIRSKTEITKILENPQNKYDLLISCEDLKNNFIFKVKSIVEDDGEQDSIDILNKNLETIFNVSSSGRRTQQSFYALWHFISKVSLKSIKLNKISIRQELHELFQLMNMIDSKDKFENKINSFWNKYTAK
ncbi:DUF262 domain-containing protein [Confluentibacter flavum]|uniref:GmrSD restriction endonucleases N-terminal domain-containing protein n=1 Tax=Confluentibacter flavum TaxID=1909700 RepID=A0A2N3HGZ2_9FLAO|nr:DUF262 domain-containing protein [Confluentibacter flavum]PKQ44249.1 hypothetical protein CSW08_14205 [Confluentibacter flavum]